MNYLKGKEDYSWLTNNILGVRWEPYVNPKWRSEFPEDVSDYRWPFKPYRKTQLSIKAKK